MNLRGVFLWIRKSFTFHDPKPVLSRALTLLIITVSLASPQMRFFRPDIVVLILTIAVVYHVLIGLFALARQSPIDRSTWKS